ncbi:MAG: hypothetical protein ACOYJD_09300 [Christensenellales bacterium]|jgi:hypothetical protein
MFNGGEIVIRNRKVRALVEEYKKTIDEKTAIIADLEKKLADAEKSASEANEQALKDRAEAERLAVFEEKWNQGEKNIAKVMLDAYREADKIKHRAVLEKETQLENLRVFTRILEGFEDAALGMAETMRNELGIIKRKANEAAITITDDDKPQVISKPEGDELSNILDEIMKPHEVKEQPDAVESFDPRAAYRAIREAVFVENDAKEDSDDSVEKDVEVAEEKADEESSQSPEVDSSYDAAEQEADASDNEEKSAGMLW